MKRRGSFSQRAFTLVEILIAVGILGMIMVAIYTSWNAILRGSRARPGSCRRCAARPCRCERARNSVGEHPDVRGEQPVLFFYHRHKG